MSEHQPARHVCTWAGNYWAAVGGRAFRAGHNLVVQHKTPCWIGHCYAACAWCDASIWSVHLVC